MKNKQRRNYNKSYYLRNRARILAKLRHSKTLRKRNSNLISFFQFMGTSTRVDNLEHKKEWAASLKVATLVTLICAMNYFLLSESSRFYIMTEGRPFDSYLKAFILEGAAFALNWTLPRRGWKRTFQYSLILILYFFSICIVSGTVIARATSERQQVILKDFSIRSLESELVSLEKRRDQLWNSNRITLAQKYEPEISTLKSNLFQMQRLKFQLPDTEIIRTNLFLLIVFRILVVTANLACMWSLRTLID